MGRRSICGVIAAWRGRRAAARMVDVACGEEFDAGFGDGMLELMNGVGLRGTEADVVRSYDQIWSTVRQLRA